MSGAGRREKRAAFSEEDAACLPAGGQSGACLTETGSVFLASGALSTCWKAAPVITPFAKVMCGKTAHWNLTDSSSQFSLVSLLFCNTD